MGETPAGAVVMELWSVAGGGPCPGGPGNLLRIFTTGADGLYQFVNLAPGSYIIRVAGSNFGGSGTLNGFTATTPTEICVNIDCNFDPNAMDYDFGFSMIVQVILHGRNGRIVKLLLKMISYVT